jgi:hypothetical protein
MLPRSSNNHTIAGISPVRRFIAVIERAVILAMSDVLELARAASSDVDSDRARHPCGTREGSNPEGTGEQWLGSRRCIGRRCPSGGSADDIGRQNAQAQTFA